LISVANAKLLCKRDGRLQQARDLGIVPDAGNILIMLRKFSYAIRYDGQLDASRPFRGFAVRNGHAGTHVSRIDRPLEK
jgi:hypothetical protein